MLKVFTLEIAHTTTENGPVYHVHSVHESRYAAELALEDIDCMFSDINEFEVQKVDFKKHIKHVSDEVATWPEWKQNSGYPHENFG